MTDSYLKVPFPYETKLTSGSSVRLLGAIGKSVIGATYGKGLGEGDEWMSQSLHWDENGQYADGQYVDMNLIPLPPKINAEIERLTALRSETQSRLDQHPDAPLIWREGDERTIRNLNRQIEDLVKQLPTEGDSND